MNVKLNAYKAYLFDMDGTLVNSEKLKGLAISKTCEYFGAVVDLNLYKEVMGEKWEVVIKHFFKHAQINPNIDQFNREFNRIYSWLRCDQLKLTPYAKEFLIDVSKRGKKIGIVSSAMAYIVNEVLDQFQLTELFDIVITKENVMHHKPHPEAYLSALNELSIKSSEALIFEDSSAGLMASKSANCDAIAVEHEFNCNNDLSMSLKVIKDFGELL